MLAIEYFILMTVIMLLGMLFLFLLFLLAAVIAQLIVRYVYKLKGADNVKEERRF